MNFTDREKAFEDLFAHDEELLFKVRAKRNKQAGLWAAGKLGKSGDEAHHYADYLVVTMLDKDNLFKFLRADFNKNNIQITDKELHAELDKFVVLARKHFMEN